MESIKTVQQRIKDKRDAYTKADLVYYNGLQQWSLSQRGISSGTGSVPATAQLDTMLGDRETALKDLNTEINTLTNGGAPQDWVAQLTADLPFLLFPVRVEARYVSVRHIVRDLDNNDAIDVSKMSPVLSTLYSTIGFKKDEEGVMTYQPISLHLFGGPSAALMQSIMNGSLKPVSGKLIKRKNDGNELRIRIYPDEIFAEGLERNLQPGEWDAGVQFWQKICAGKDPQEQWMQLSLSVTAPRAAWIVHATTPSNFVQGNPLPSTPQFTASKLLKDGAFTYPLKTHVLPDRFVVRLYKGNAFKEFTGNAIPEPLLLGLDPTHDPFNKTTGSGFSDNGTAIQTPDYLSWMHDFDAAETAGMAVRIDLSQNPEYLTGVDRIVVLGTKLSVNETDAAALLARQMEDHLYRENGLSVIQQGTPTNNYGTQTTSFNQRQQNALSYFGSQFQPHANSPFTTDETRVISALGLQNAPRLPYGGLMEISEASLLNEMLWPATWGYYLLQFFSPDLDELTREQARQFFIQHVSGRGTLPVLRFNCQPYGIIPVSSFADWKYQPAGITAEEQFLSQLWTLFLSPLNGQWKTLTANVKNVNVVSGQGLDDNFFQMIGISASADQLQKQWVASTQIQDVLQAAGPPIPGAGPGSSLFGNFSEAAENDLTKIGINPAFFNQLTTAYNTPRQQVRRIFMDGRPLSETQPLERINGKAWNFPQWLAQSKLLDIWSSNFENAPAGDGSTLSSADISAFSILLKQAVLRIYLETGMRAVEPNNGLWLLKVKDFPAQNLQHTTLNIDPAALPPTDKLQQLYKPIIDRFQLTQPFSLEPDRRVYFSGKYPATGALTLADWIETRKSDPSFQPLNKMITGLQYISNLSTASLNRLYTEHMDLCSHRLDAWMLGLVNQRLVKQRKTKPSGIYLGSFGYLLDLKPNAVMSVVFKEEPAEYMPLAPANVGTAAIPIIHADAAKQNGLELTGNGWKNAFFYIGDNAAAGVRLNTATGNTEPDTSINVSQTDGFIHAPSPEHATAAAILRTGYLNHQTDNQTALLALQLNSPRTRQALQLLEGMQLGTSLNELLGYYFERKLKENNLSNDIYNLRIAFPVQRTTEQGKSVSYLTTTDGLSVLNRRRGNPAAWLTTVAGISPGDFAKINLVTDTLEDYLDALGDLLLAEGVYQSVKGNTVRAAAALKIMNSGGQVVMPDFANIPVKGSSITHRVGVVCNQNTAANDKVWTTNGSPRAMLMPDLNAWLSLQLPKPANVVITVVLVNGEKQKLTLADLGIEPADLLYAFPDSFAQPSQTALGLIIQAVAQQKFAFDIPAGPAAFSIDFRERSLLTATQLTIFEISSLVLNLKKLISQSRPISANDFLLPDKAAAADTYTDCTPLKTAIIKQVQGNTAVTQLIKSLRSQAAALAAGLNQNKPDAGLQALIKPIFTSLQTAWQQGIDSSISEGVFYFSKDAAALIAAKATDTAAQLESRMAKAASLAAAIPAALAGVPLFEKLKEITDLLYGTSMPVWPDVALANVTEVTTAYAGRQLIDNATADIIDDWVREASLVRKYLKVYRNCALLAEILTGAATIRPLTVLQFPFFTGIKQPWIGNKLPEDLPQEQRATLSLVMDLPDAFQPKNKFAGFIIDAWPEWVPSKTADTSIAFQYNQPNTEPPQTLLMAVTPVEGGNWSWDYLTGAVNEALELAKKRLVTPADIRGGNLGLNQVLPAVLMPFMPASQQTPVINAL